MFYEYSSGTYVRSTWDSLLNQIYGSTQGRIVWIYYFVIFIGGSFANGGWVNLMIVCSLWTNIFCYDFVRLLLTNARTYSIWNQILRIGQMIRWKQKEELYWWLLARLGSGSLLNILNKYINYLQRLKILVLYLMNLLVVGTVVHYGIRETFTI